MIFRLLLTICTNKRYLRWSTLLNVPINAAVSQAASPFLVCTIKGAPGVSHDTCHDIPTGLQNFFKIGGPKWPMEQNVVGHFLKWWAQAYQTKHSWHLCSILYLHIDTDTCMHKCKLTADYTVKPVVSDHSKKKTNYCLMGVKSIAECFAIL